MNNENTEKPSTIYEFFGINKKIFSNISEFFGINKEKGSEIARWLRRKIRISLAKPLRFKNIRETAYWLAENSDIELAKPMISKKIIEKYRDNELLFAVHMFDRYIENLNIIVEAKQGLQKKN